MIGLEKTARVARCSQHHPLPILCTNAWLLPCIPITHHIMPIFSLSPMSPNGENPFLLLAWLHLVRHFWSFPYTCHWKHATLLDLGRSKVVQLMIIAGFPSHANGPGWSLATKHSPCYPLDRDNYCTRALRPVTVARCSCPFANFLCAGARWQ